MNIMVKGRGSDDDGDEVEEWRQEWVREGNSWEGGKVSLRGGWVAWVLPALWNTCASSSIMRTCVSPKGNLCTRRMSSVGNLRTPYVVHRKPFLPTTLGDNHLASQDILIPPLTTAWFKNTWPYCKLQISAFFLFSNIRKGRLLYIHPVGWLVGRLVGWSVDVTINFFNIYRHKSPLLTQYNSIPISTKLYWPSTTSTNQHYSVLTQ